MLRIARSVVILFRLATNARMMDSVHLALSRFSPKVLYSLGLVEHI